MKEHLFLLVLALIPLTSKADDSGSCGENVTYKYEESTKTLTISGTGKMYNYDSKEKPWSNLDVVKIIIEDGVTSICAEAFMYNGILTTVDISNSVMEIGRDAFFKCSNLINVNLPNKLTKISEGTFRYCSGLTSIVVPNSVTSIEGYAFSDCTGLMSIEISDNVTEIGESAFSRCGITTINIPEGITDIPAFIFWGCKYLKSIQLPESVTSIGYRSFYECSSLDEINIPSKVTSIGDYAFYRCRSLNAITMPNSIKSIGEHAFHSCNGLNSIVLSENIDRIQNNTFYDCTSLQELNIPSSVQYVYQEAFAYCSNLKRITVFAKTPPIAHRNAFDDYRFDYINLYVPSEALNAYQTTSPWSEFININIIEEGSKEQCATPSMEYENGKLTFKCETEGVDYNYSITNSDIGDGVGNSVNLAVTYNISVYASKVGYLNSDVVNGTLCWVEKEPHAEGINNDISMLPSNAVMIQSQGGLLTIQGADEGSQIKVYGIDGIMVGSVVSQNGQAQVNTDLQPGAIAIIKIGNEKSVKIIVK